MNAADIHGATPLMFAALRDSVEVVRILLDADADINASNAKETALFNSVMNTTPAAAPIARLLLDRGADPTAATSDGFSPIAFAQRYGTPAIREVFSDLL